MSKNKLKSAKKAVKKETRGRPKIRRSVHVLPLRISPKLAKTLKTLAKSEKVSRNELIERFLIKAVLA